jgi:hypothetical protein
MKSNKNLFGSRFYTLLQIKLVLARLGLHIERQTIKLQKVNNAMPHRGGGGVSRHVTKCYMEEGGLKWS